MKKYNLRNLTMLVVERQLLMRRLVRDVIVQLGVPAGNIRVASDTGSAYEMFVDLTPDVILTDWAPMLDGIKFIHKIRNSADSSDPFVPIIVVTSFSELRHIVKARNVGMTEYLTKPISARTLYTRICAVIERSRTFVRCNDFFGPDRRRRRLEFQGNEKRDAEPKASRN